MRLDALTDMQLDALREIGSIGAGHAATALSQLVHRPVGLQVPTIEVIDTVEVPYVFGGPEELVCAVYAQLLGDIGGGVLFLVSEESALSLVDLLRGQSAGATRSWGAGDEDMLEHAGAILTAAYVAAIATMAQVNVLPSAHAMVCDMAGAILQTVVIDVDMRAEQAVLARTAFLNERDKVDAALFFLPDPDSLSVLLRNLGLA